MTDKPLPLQDHLEEIRKRALVVFFVFILFSSMSFYYVKELLNFLKIPAGEELGRLSVFSPTAAILSFFKIAFACGFACTLPVILYEIWMFIRPAMDRRLARKGLLFIVSGTALFTMGALFSFFFLVPASLRFLLSIGKDELWFMISLDSYVSFVLAFMLGGGLVFEMPCAAFILSKAGILTSHRMVHGWRVALVVILIAAGLITPTPDVVNMMLMAAPMLVLYLFSVFVARLAEPKKAGVK